MRCNSNLRQFIQRCVNGTNEQSWTNSTACNYVFFTINSDVTTQRKSGELSIHFRRSESTHTVHCAQCMFSSNRVRPNASEWTMWFSLFRLYILGSFFECAFVTHIVIVYVTVALGSALVPLCVWVSETGKHWTPRVDKSLKQHT